jgi:hypothetical protein
MLEGESLMSYQRKRLIAQYLLPRSLPKKDNRYRDMQQLIEINGAPGETRTPDPLVRSQVLYPAELRAHSNGGERGIRTLDGVFSPILP